MVVRDIPRLNGGLQVTCRRGDDITDAMAWRGFMVVFDTTETTGKYDLPTVNISTTNNATLFGELQEVNEDTVTVEVHDMVLRGNGPYVVTNNGNLALGHTDAGEIKPGVSAAYGPRIYGGFAFREPGASADQSFFRVTRL